MGSIPEYTKGVIKPRAIAQTADPNAVRDAGSTFRGMAAMADVGYELAQKHKEANDKTALNDAIIAKQKDDIEFIYEQRKKNDSNPFDFAKRIEPELTKRDEERMKMLPSKEARNAYLESSKRLNLGIYEDNFNWENTRKTQIYAARIENAVKNNKTNAYMAGASGKPFQGFLENADATAYSAGGIFHDEKISDIRHEARTGAYTSWLEGVSESNPLEALRQIQSDDAKKMFKSPDEYIKVKEAIETRAVNIQKINGEKEVLNILKDENALLAKSMTNPISYDELQDEFARTGISKEAQSYFMKANGYSKDADGETLSPSEKMSSKAKLYSDLTLLMQKDDLTADDVSGFQKKIYSAMNSRVITDKEGSAYISQLLDPVIAQKEEQYSKFSQNSWISPNIGFGGIQEVFEKKYEIKPAEGEKEVGALSQSINNQRKVKLYDYYMSALSDQAQSYGVTLADIKSLNRPQQRKLYSDAQAQAEIMMAKDINPLLATLPDVPNQVLSKGKLIQGAAGDRAIKPDFSVKQNFVIIEKDGRRARKYADGTIEEIF